MRSTWACVSGGTTSGPTHASSTMPASTTNPSNPMRLRARSARVRQIARPGALAQAVKRVILWLLARNADARIEPAGEQIGHAGRDQHGDGGDEEHALHHRVVTAVDGLAEQQADALVHEDFLDQDRAADHEA